MPIAKKKKLILTDLRHINGKVESCFKVKKITNTTRFQIDQYLSKREVDDEIAYNPDMTIEIVKKKR